MSKKKWHDDIPAGGVLCKSSSGNVHLITSISGRYKDATTPSGNTYDVRNLTPLTAAEWWYFAPWQDMEDAPLYEPILAKWGNGNVSPFTFTNDAKPMNIVGWLPLPQVSK